MYIRFCIVWDCKRVGEGVTTPFKWKLVSTALPISFPCRNTPPYYNPVHATISNSVLYWKQG